jgi:cytochrome c553
MPTAKISSRASLNLRPPSPPRRGRLLHHAAVLAAAALLQLPAGLLAAPDLARAEEIVQGKCFICHGAEGESSSPVFPRLAGQNATYLARQLADYRSGKRKSSAMQPMVDDLTPADFQALGAFFASRATIGHAVADPDLAQMGRFIYLRGNPYSGVASCATCHGNDAHGTETLPRLAGQHAQYTENQLRQFNTRERTNDNAVMHAIASKLTELELKAVASYISGLK